MPTAPKHCNDFLAVEAEHLPQCEVAIPRYQLILQPWKDWTEEERPDWWSKSYNKLKHQRHEYFANATLESVLNSVGAQLLVLQLYHYVATGEHVSVDI